MKRERWAMKLEFFVVKEGDSETVKGVVRGLGHDRVDDVEVGMGSDPIRDAIAEVIALFGHRRREDLDTVEGVVELLYAPRGRGRFGCQGHRLLFPLKPPPWLRWFVLFTRLRRFFIQALRGARRKGPGAFSWPTSRVES